MSVPDLNYILNYLDRVKKTFLYRPKKFQRLQRLWSNYVKKSIDFKELLDCLSGLFNDDPPLVQEFNKLLPLEFQLKTPVKRAKRQRAPSEDESTKDEANAKKPKVSRSELVVNEYSMYGMWEEFVFFDEVRKLLGNELTYLNFLRCIQLFNRNLIDGAELFHILLPFISKSPRVLGQLRGMLHHHLDGRRREGAGRKGRTTDTSLPREVKEYEIDFSSCRKLGSSYRALKLQTEQKSGKSNLCKEVLNDVWVSFPLWSEDPVTTSESQGGCKITSIQEFFYKCEDERFELDIVIDQVSSTISALEEVQRKMSSMSQEEVMSLRLDDSLGGSSGVLQRKVIERIYGDKAKDLLEGLKTKPFIGVPIALRRLKAKQQEWVEHRNKFNKMWSENTEKHSQRSLNCELALVKQNDLKDARTKVILNEAEAIREESLMLTSIYGLNCPMQGNHFSYPNEQVSNDLDELIHFNLACLSEDRSDVTPVAVGAATTATVATSAAPASVHMDKNLLYYCKHTLHLLSMSYDDQLNASDVDCAVNLTPEVTPAATAVPDEDAAGCDPEATGNGEVVMYQTSRWLILISLHHKLYSRLSKIRAVSDQESLERDEGERAEGTSKKKTKAIYLDLGGKEDCLTLYLFALSLLRSCAGGACETYEDHVRKTIARAKNDSSFNYNDVSYWIVSLDKLLKNVVRELQQLASDEMTRKATCLFERSRHSMTNGVHMKYRHKALKLLARDSCYKITFKRNWHKVVVDLLNPADDESSRDVTKRVASEQRWQDYIARFVSDQDCDPTLKGFLSPPFLKRNLRKEVPKDLVVSGSDQYAFLPNSYKLRFPAASHSVLISRSSVHTNDRDSRGQCIRRCVKFSRLWSQWQTQNLTPVIEQKFTDWMFGMKKNSVKVLEISDDSKPPYRNYKKYVTAGKL